MANIKIYNVFSGTIFEIPEKDLKVLDISQIPLKKNPNPNCKKCYGKGYSGRDKDNFAFYACSCVVKVVDHDKSQIQQNPLTNS